MIAEIITIGDEILIGQIINTNSTWIAIELNKIGVRVKQITSVADNKTDIVNAINEGFTHADILIVTGGLGPTKDDITKHTLCEYFNTRLVANNTVLENIQNLVKSFGGTHLNALNVKQAEVPEKCIVLPNPVGTAPGMWFDKDEHKILISLPGVPHEMETIMKNSVLHKLKVKYQLPYILHKNILTSGIAESDLAERLNAFEEQLPPNVSLAYLPSIGMTKLRLTIIANTKIEAEKLVDNLLLILENEISEFILGYDEENLTEMIGKLLIAKNKTLSIAESCTGGNISKTIVAVAGSSQYFTGSVVAYSNKIKENILKVNIEDIIEHGAVSIPVVEQMAEGIKKIMKTDYAIATSGVAGPDGGTVDKPVGTVCIAIATPQKTISEKYIFGLNRERNIVKATNVALGMLYKEIQKT